MNSKVYQWLAGIGHRLLQPVLGLVVVCACIMRALVGCLAWIFEGGRGWTPEASADALNIPTSPSSSRKTGFTYGNGCDGESTESGLIAGPEMGRTLNGRTDGLSSLPKFPMMSREDLDEAVPESKRIRKELSDVRADLIRYGIAEERKRQRSAFDLAERSIRFLNFIRPLAGSVSRPLNGVGYGGVDHGFRCEGRDGGHCRTRLVGIADGGTGIRWHLFQLPCGSVYGFDGQGAQ